MQVQLDMLRMKRWLTRLRLYQAVRCLILESFKNPHLDFYFHCLDLSNAGLQFQADSSDSEQERAEGAEWAAAVRRILTRRTSTKTSQESRSQESSEDDISSELDSEDDEEFLPGKMLATCSSDDSDKKIKPKEKKRGQGNAV